ncbi:hypothetical protein PIB30_072302 [Stylosanthes scabra]|uniref:GRF-type domain-containing protein n=1 Tax=Stylosanthes scabra TaxID=79078 RepID=A0ABU6VNR0_9FABA|nr:hypothetical protein [Stylosanthes scabra]
MFNLSIGHMPPTYFQFSSQSSASRPGSVSLDASSNPSPQTPIYSSPNSQYSDFANPCGLEAIELNDDKIGNQRQRSTPLWQWEEDEMLISAWLNISTDPVVETDQKSDIFWNRINNYFEEHNPMKKRGTVATKKRWYKFSKAVAKFAWQQEEGMQFTHQRLSTATRGEAQVICTVPRRAKKRRGTSIWSVASTFCNYTWSSMPLEKEEACEHNEKTQNAKRKRRSEDVEGLGFILPRPSTSFSSGMVCGHGEPVVLRTSRTKENPERCFWGCVRYPIRFDGVWKLQEQCGFFCWADKDPSEVDPEKEKLKQKVLKLKTRLRASEWKMKDVVYVGLAGWLGIFYMWNLNSGKYHPHNVKPLNIW